MQESPRFLKLTDVAEILNTSERQVQALVQRGELRAIKIGGRGQWRVEDSALEAYIAAAYAATEQYIADHPVPAALPDEAPGDTPDADAAASHGGTAPSARGR
jgi:excisionase family DNA binding protein